MGQNSEDMISGRACAICGQYFADPGSIDGEFGEDVYEHGYPVACKECWEKDCGYQKAEVGTF